MGCHSVYQDMYLDLCEMRYYVVVHKYRLVIDLELEPAVASLASRMAPYMHAAQIRSVRTLRRGYTKGLSAPRRRSVKIKNELILYFVKPYRPYNRNPNQEDERSKKSQITLERWDGPA
jgi:hypothetical protein